MSDMDWDDPAARAELLWQVGVKKYNRLLEEHCRRSSGGDYARIMQQGLGGEGGRRMARPMSTGRKA